MKTQVRTGGRVEGEYRESTPSAAGRVGECCFIKHSPALPLSLPVQSKIKKMKKSKIMFRDPARSR